MSEQTTRKQNACLPERVLETCNSVPVRLQAAERVSDAEKWRRSLLSFAERLIESWTQHWNPLHLRLQGKHRWTKESEKRARPACSRSWTTELEDEFARNLDHPSQGKNSAKDDCNTAGIDRILLLPPILDRTIQSDQTSI